MVLINNITDIATTIDSNGTNRFQLKFYKDNYNNEIHIKKDTFTSINNKKSNLNVLNIFNIQFNNYVTDNSGMIIHYNNNDYNIKEILFQTQTTQNLEEWVKANIIALKLEDAYSSLNWYTIFDLGIIFEKLIYFDTTLFDSLESCKMYDLFTNMTTSTNISNVNLSKIFGLLNDRILLPHSGKIFQEKGFSLNFFPLIKPLPKLTISTKLKTNKSQFVMFNNYSKIDIPEYLGYNFDSLLNDGGIIIQLKPLRITDNVGESISLDIVADVNSINNELYTMSYDNPNNDFDVSFNIFTFTFVNNYSREYYYYADGTKIQNNNKILLNTKINREIVADANGNFDISDNNTNAEIFQNIFNKSVAGENNHLKMNIIGINEELFDYFDLGSTLNNELKLNINNTFNSNIKLFIRNILNDNQSGKLFLSENINDENSIFILKKEELFSDKLGINDGILELYPRVNDDDILKYNGTFGQISITSASTNPYFSNLIIENIDINITGITNEKKILLNISENNEIKLSNTNLNFSAMNDDFFYTIQFRPIPITTVNKESSVELKYKVETRGGIFIFTRLNHFDNSIGDIDMEDVVVYDKEEGSNIQDFKIKTKGYAIDFNVVENNTYNFDMSDKSNIGQTLRFFKHSAFTQELVSQDDEFIGGIPVAIYSGDPGYAGASVKITIPKFDDTRLTNGIIYYANKDPGQKMKTGSGGIIQINKIKNINVKRSMVDNITSNSSAVLSYNPPNYDIFSTKYNITNDWYDVSFNIDNAFKSRINADLSYNFDSNNPGKLCIYNVGQWYDKQVFIDSDISFNRKNDEITKIRFNHNLDNAILNIGFIDCSSTATHNLFNNNKLNINSNHFLKRDENLNDISYNYYAILKNNSGQNETFLFEKYNEDFSGNIYLLGSVIDNIVIFCQIKLYNQYNFNERTSNELLYKINFENILGSEKIRNSAGIPANKDLSNYIDIYKSSSDICNNIVCSNVIINKDKSGNILFKDIHEHPTLNLVFKDDLIQYGIGNNNIFNTGINNNKIDYKFVGNTDFSHKLFIIVNEEGKIFFGDNDDNYLLLNNDNKIVPEHFKMIMSLQDISYNDSEDKSSYDLNLQKRYPIEIDNIYIRNIGGLRGSPAESSDVYDLSSVSVLNTDLGEFSTYVDSLTNGLFSTNGNYTGLNSNDSEYNTLLSNNLYDISGITGTVKKHPGDTNIYYNSVDIDKKNDISGGKHGYWFVVDISSDKFVDEICITGTSDLDSNPKSFYIYGSDCSSGSIDPSNNTDWFLLNRFSFIPNIYNYEIDKNEYNSFNNYKIYRDLYVYIQPKNRLADAQTTTAKPFRYYRIHVLSNFGSNALKIKKIEFFEKSVVMKNFARSNIKYYKPYLNVNDKRTSLNVQNLFDKIMPSNTLITDHLLNYDVDQELNLESKTLTPFGLFANNTYKGLINRYSDIIGAIAIESTNYYNDIKNNDFHDKETLSNNNRSDVYLKTYHDHDFSVQTDPSGIPGLYFTIEPENTGDILQTITILGLKNDVLDSETGITINSVNSNIKKIFIFGKKLATVNDDDYDDGDDATANINEDDDIYIPPFNKYSDFDWQLIAEIDYNINDFTSSNDGYVKKWIKNINNSQNTYSYYRIVISENFGEKYIYIGNIRLGMAKNSIDKRKRQLELTNFSYNIIKHIPKNEISDTGFFDISFKVREVCMNYLTNKETFNTYSAYNDISLNGVTAYITDIKKCTNIRHWIIGSKTVLLEWEFTSSDIYIDDLYFEIYRLQNTTDSITSNKKIYIGQTRQRYFYDYNPIRYLIANYYIKPVIIWENEKIEIDETSYELFVCKNNKFKYGRYNIRTDNPKLFAYTNGALTLEKNDFINEKITTGTNCIKNNMVNNSRSTILFKNTNIMTRKQLYSMLSKNMKRPFR